MNQINITHLLWTGGWDSTFRLLELLLNEKKTVIPHYIIGKERRSYPVEISAMDSIREKIASRFPHDADRLLPTRFFKKTQIRELSRLTKASGQIRKRVRMDPQYEWISRYCRQHQLERVNLCVIDHAPGSEPEIFINMLRHLKNPGFVPGQKEIMEHLADLFKPFELPFLNFTKNDLLIQARKNDWMDMMELTWFRYNPKIAAGNGYEPCGGCVTCRGQYKHNFQWRIPVRQRVLQRAYRFKKRLLNRP